jgi:hypothetical protein
MFNEPSQRLCFGLIVVAAMPLSAWAQSGIHCDKTEIKTDKVAPNLYMLLSPTSPDFGGEKICRRDRAPMRSATKSAIDEETAGSAQLE